MLSPRTPALLLLVLAACDVPEPEPEDPPPVVPDGPRCEPVRTGTDAAAEDALLAEINALRAQGGRCGALTFLPAPALYFDPALRCAARLHTADMITRKYLGSLDPDGLGPGARLAEVEFTASSFAENVGIATADADGDPRATAADIAATWADNPTTCWKLHARELTVVGIGAIAGEYTFKDMDPTAGTFFTATFAAP